MSQRERDMNGGSVKKIARTTIYTSIAAGRQVDGVWVDGYAPGWDAELWLSVRELWQEIIDQASVYGRRTDVTEKVMPDGTVKLVLKIWRARMERSHLTLGCPSYKSDIDHARAEAGESGTGSAVIGHHREGTKLAALSLLRRGCTFRMKTGDEQWTFKILPSPQFDGQNVLAIETAPATFEDATTTTVTGLPRTEWEACKKRVLSLSGRRVLFAVEGLGSLLDGEPGSLYVGGLYVSGVDTRRAAMYSFDLDPSRISLDRDRNRVDGYELSRAVTELLSAAIEAGYIGVGMIREMADTGKWEAYTMGELSHAVSRAAMEKIVEAWECGGGGYAVDASTAESLTVLGRRACAANDTWLSLLYDTRVGGREASAFLKTWKLTYTEVVAVGSRAADLEWVSGVCARAVGWGGEFRLASFNDPMTLGANEVENRRVFLSVTLTRAELLVTAVHELAHFVIRERQTPDERRWSSSGGSHDMQWVAEQERIWTAVIDVLSSH